MEGGRGNHPVRHVGDLSAENMPHGVNDGGGEDSLNEHVLGIGNCEREFVEYGRRLAVFLDEVHNLREGDRRDGDLAPGGC